MYLPLHEFLNASISDTLRISPDARGDSTFSAFALTNCTDIFLTFLPPSWMKSDDKESQRKKNQEIII